MDRYTEQDTQPISEAPAFFMTGFGYSVMHATKPGTIGLTVAASPLSLSLSLCRPGSVLCTEPGADIPLPLDTILATVTLSWLTNTHPRCIYSNNPRLAGGHFPALEEPESMLAGPEEFLQETIPHDLAPREVQS
ncbi:putative epoxide hydrolase [Colletotrichum orbiculare MAFF 240422]|uniref:Epoxide hydrolase n=1 Tax=Colletotrichum orbiculare (strain 104-T / ATCC 96160 / CBS 514.97 / LARS 414 / MAFF 240422) TaxID=1213857 RepID=N4VKV3_COLOR|nr:putative epoxide hydrolase [Colletotrichum orbiculare MAFF 240422]